MKIHSCPTGLIGGGSELEKGVGLQLGNLPQGRSCKRKPTASNAQLLYALAPTVQSDSQPFGAWIGAPIRRGEQEPHLQALELCGQPDLCLIDPYSGTERRVRCAAVARGAAFGHSRGHPAEQECPLARQPGARRRPGRSAVLENAGPTAAARLAVRRGAAAPPVCLPVQTNDSTGIP